MAFSDYTIERLVARRLDIELMSNLGFDTDQKSWPVEHEGAKTTFTKVDALMIPFFRRGEIVRKKWKAWDRPEGSPAYLQEKGGKRIAWNEDCLHDPSLFGKPLIITEGELDAVSAIQAGFPKVISVPDGAPPPGEREKGELLESTKYAWVRDILRTLLTVENCPEIILAVDDDDNGRALLQDLSAILGRARCKFLTYPKLRPGMEPFADGRMRCKDLNEVLVRYREDGVRKTLGTAEWVKVKGVATLSQLPPLPDSIIYEVGIDAFGEHYKARLGDLAVWTGIPSHGKTTVVQDVVCRIADRYGVRIGMAAFENAPQRDYRRALRQWKMENWEDRLSAGELAEADQWIEDHFAFIVPDEDDDPTLEWMLDAMETAVVRFGVRVMVIDPWNEMDHVYNTREENEVQYLNRAVKTLRRFARRFQVHLILVAHPTKLEANADGVLPKPTPYDINGGAVWANKADLLVRVHRIGDGTEAATLKSRHHEIIGKPGAVLLAYCAQDRRFRETERLPDDLLNPDKKPTSRGKR